MATASRLQLEALKGLVLRHMKAVAAKGLYIIRNQQLPPEIAKMPAGLARLKKEHELNAAGKPRTLDINFVFSTTIPRLGELGVFNDMTEAEADAVIGKIVGFASLSVKKAEELRVSGGDHKGYYESIKEFFAIDLISYSNWIKRKKDIDEVVAFKAGMRSEDREKKIEAIRKAGEVGLVEAAEEIQALFSESGESASMNLAVMEAMEKLFGRKKALELMSARSGYIKNIVIEGIKAQSKGASAMAYTPLVENMSELVPEELKGRYSHRMVEVDGKIYLFGGEEHGNYLNDFWVFDTKSRTWEDKSGTVPKELEPRKNHQMMVGPDKKIYLFGGHISPKDSFGQKRSIRSTDLWVYDPRTEKWAFVLQSMSEYNLHSYKAVMAGDTIYLFNQQSDNPNVGDVYAMLWAYDINKTSWENVSNYLPEDMKTDPHSYKIIAGTDNKIYFIPVWRSQSSSIRIFDLSTKTWDKRTDPFKFISIKSIEMATGEISAGRIHFFGGDEDPRGRGKYLWVYDPGKDKLEDYSGFLPDGLVGRTGHHMAMGSDGYIYIFGGGNDIGVHLRDFWRIRIDAFTLDRISDEQIGTIMQRIKEKIVE